MAGKRKIIFQAILFFMILALTFWGVFHGEDLGKMGEAILDCKVQYLIPAVGCVFVFIWGESLILWHMLDTYGIHTPRKICFLFSSVGFFFSCVTPSASGGQPMQIYFMKKEKISVPIATIILMVVTIIYKLVLVVIGLGIIFFHRGFMHTYLEPILPVFYLGLFLNVVCVTALTVLVFHPYLAEQIMEILIYVLERMRILKHKPDRLKKLQDSMDTYRNTAAFMKNHVDLMIRVILITFGQRMALFAVTCFVYMAFGLKGTSLTTILFLQAVISVSVDMLPLPGGMGISETLFLAIFLPVFGETLLLPAMVLGRGLGYYSELLISAIFTLIAIPVISKREKHRKEQEAAQKIVKQKMGGLS